MVQIKKHARQFSRVHIEEDKITDYLLNKNHKLGKEKAKFFGLMGFSPDFPEELSNVLSKHCTTAELEAEENSEWGTKYTFVCDIQPPKGRAVCIVSVWQIDKGRKTPRLITAYPENNRPRKTRGS